MSRSVFIIFTFASVVGGCAGAPSGDVPESTDEALSASNPYPGATEYPAFRCGTSGTMKERVSVSAYVRGGTARKDASGTARVSGGTLVGIRASHVTDPGEGMAGANTSYTLTVTGQTEQPDDNFFLLPVAPKSKQGSSVLDAKIKTLGLAMPNERNKKWGYYVMDGARKVVDKGELTHDICETITFVDWTSR